MLDKELLWLKIRNKYLKKLKLPPRQPTGDPANAERVGAVAAAMIKASKEYHSLLKSRKGNK